MDKATLRNKIYSKINELPTLPSTIGRLLTLFEDKNSNASLITEVILKDPSLAAKILKVANSAYYGFSQKISDLERAVALLGFNMVKSLAISISVMKNLPLKNKTSLSGKELWNHSVTVAILMREMGKRLYNEKENEYLFILGLLHDVGLVVFDQFFNESYQEVTKEADYVDRKDFYKIEQRIIGFDHGETGGILLTRWNFPPIISQSVTGHHHFFEDEPTREIALLKLGDKISHIDTQSEVKFQELDEELNSVLQWLGTDNSFINEILDFRESVKDEIASFFNAVT